MKIPFTIVKDGISYGIPEGTKVPEKPNNREVENMYEASLPRWQNKLKAYQDDIQALLSVAIQWEPPNGVVQPTPVDGIYPLKGVEANEVWQYRVKGYTAWVDCSKKPTHQNTRFDYRTFLRLIPQHNSEQKYDSEPCTDRCALNTNDGVSEPGPKRNAVSEMLVNNLSSGVNESRDPRTICPLSDNELLQACHKAITDMCQKQRWQMSVPPDMRRDSDMLLSELCTRFERVSGEAKTPVNSAHSYTEGSELPPKHNGVNEYKDWGSGNPIINKLLFESHFHLDFGSELYKDKIVYSEEVMHKVIEMVRAEAKPLREALKNLTEATEDKNGQFSSWHKHLRAMTKAAKELL